MTEIKKTARLAGLVYLLMGIVSPLGILIIPSRFVTAGDPAATAAALVASPLLFRAGIVSTILSQLIFLILAVILYKLFRNVYRTYAVFMAACVVAAVPVAFILSFVQMGALSAAEGTGYFAAVDPAVRNSVMMLSLNIHDTGMIMIGVFWGLWLFPFGMLVYKSGFIPKIFGVLLIVNCTAYLIDSLTYMLFPSVREVITAALMVPMMIGELPIIAWLLIKGAKTDKPAVRPA